MAESPITPRQPNCIGWSIITAGEFHKLLPHVREPYRTMVLIAGCPGLRAGEIVGLQWDDFNFEKSTLLVQRGIVHGRVGDVKTEYEVAGAQFLER